MDASLNIVNLIETNPITRLSHNYNNRFINKIKDVFTETQQQIFVSSFYCYLNYNQTTDFVIDFENVWQWLGFSQKAMAKRSLEKYFVIDKDYKVLLCRSAEQTNEGRGGHNKQTILLNIRTFKLFCIKAETQKANEIHEYFIKLEDILHQIVQEESDELKKQLENATKITDKKMLEIKQDILLKKFGPNSSVIYIIKVKTYENGEYVVKIGESGCLNQRYIEHKKNYEECLLLDCFEVNKRKQFESFLHHHDKIRFNRVKDLPNHEKEFELFRIGNELTYDILLKIINDNIHNFNNWSINDIINIIQEENQKILNNSNSYANVAVLSNENIANNDTINYNLLNKIEQLENNLLRKIENLEKTNKEILEQLNKPQIKTATNFQTPLATLGPKLQKINPETGTLVKLYESAAECIKESKGDINRQSLVNAINYNTIYRGFRWMYVERDDPDPTTIKNYQPTKVTRPQNIDYIAKLDADKTKILNVYLNRKTAAIENGYQSHGALDEPVKNCKISNGHFYIMYNNCDDNLREDFENEHGVPVLYKDGIGQFDSEQNLVQEFECKDKCVKQLQISESTIRKAMEANAMYNNFYYKKLGSKLKMI